MAITQLMIGGLWGGMFLLGLVGIVGGFLHYRRERLLTHQERMKALELGAELPDDAATARIKAVYGTSATDKSSDESESIARKCFTTALWVAFWGFLAAASPGGPARFATATSVAIAASAGAIGVTAMICGTILAMRPPARTITTKPGFEADTYDTVARRGG